MRDLLGRSGRDGQGGLAPAVQSIASTLSTPRLLGIGCAVPGLSRNQSDIAAELAELWQLTGSRLDRWRRIACGTRIEQRYGVAPVEEIVHLSTAQRMSLYEAHAPGLAADAAQRALESAGVRAGEITDLIVVSCTGFYAPGLDIALLDRLGLSPTVRRCMIGFMGCFGAISGLRAAVGACSADPRAVALVVCCELCSLHVPGRPGVQDQVAAALFGDGAGAAVVAGREASERLREAAREGRAGGAAGRSRKAASGGLTLGHSRVIPEGREWMTWRVTDAGFAMTLDKAVPGALRETLPAFVDEAIEQTPRTFVVHPGGPGILEAVDDALDLDNGCGLECSWGVLRRFGNVSSATVLFVLDEIARTGRLTPPGLLLAFGPGLTIESIGLLSE